MARSTYALFHQLQESFVHEELMRQLMAPWLRDQCGIAHHPFGGRWTCTFDAWGHRRFQHILKSLEQAQPSFPILLQHPAFPKKAIICLPQSNRQIGMNGAALHLQTGLAISLRGQPAAPPPALNQYIYKPQPSYRLLAFRLALSMACSALAPLSANQQNTQGNNNASPSYPLFNLVASMTQKQPSCVSASNNTAIKHTGSTLELFATTLKNGRACSSHHARQFTSDTFLYHSSRSSRHTRAMDQISIRSLACTLIHGTIVGAPFAT